MITLTYAAASHFKNYIPANFYLKLSLASAGCSGVKYVTSIESCRAPNWHVFVSEGIKICVAEEDLQKLDGTIIDFTTSPTRLGLMVTFQNPNEKDKCGCGESFRL